MDESEFRQRLAHVLEEIRPYLNADGGDVEFVRFIEAGGVLELKWLGTCKICPLSKLTLRAGVERAVMNGLPEVKRVEAVEA